KVVALEGLSVQIPRAAVGLLGANGAGKSTLIKLLLGLQSPASGDATVLGYNVRTEPLRMREHVGYMPESESLPLDVTAADFVGHMAEISGLPARAARLRAAETLYQCGVDEERYRLMREFSTGMKQRVKLAQAIVHDPDLVFLDEPTNGMDPAGRDDMLRLISRIHNDLGITVILSSHLLEDVEQVCDYVVMLENGRLAINGPLTSLVQGEGDVVVQIDGDIDRFIDALRARGLEARRRDRDILVTFRDDTVFDTVRDVSIELDVLLRGLRRDTRTLEDVYLQRMSQQPENEAVDVHAG
ncbi:MAG TPA: ABC transporter ATP-binding protein, partial [Nitrolancea sp.]|nr:ABC transporter ATP-binding protein [Nitrolancea sp.]